jgi:NTP pyrophosphatase (non-canonical NTP hydrolase)
MDKLTVNELVKHSYQNAIAHGWHDEPRTVGDLICLMHSELSEALEEYRNGHSPNQIYYNEMPKDKPEGIPIELADCIIRIFDFCGLHNIDLEQALTIKMQYNKTRPYRHGGKKV